MNPTPEAPSAAELQANPVVQAAFAAAWADSFPDDRVMRHEEGGYIYANPATGDVTVRRELPGSRRQIDLSAPPVVPDSYLVATYHTHPTPITDNGDPYPSPDDEECADSTGVPWFVVTEIGILVVGPDRRVGGLAGPAGYPQ